MSEFQPPDPPEPPDIDMEVDGAPATIGDVKHLVETALGGLDLFYVKREEYNLLLQEVASLNAVVRQRGQQLAKDTCQGGKYAGVPRATVIETDPEYVCWLKDNNTGQRIGFTDEETAQARARVAQKGPPPPRNYGPVKGTSRFTPPENRSPAKGGRGFDEYDDDIPF